MKPEERDALRALRDEGELYVATEGNPRSGNLPVPTSYAALAAVLRGMADLVEQGDSYEGSIEYTIPTSEDALPPPTSDEDQPDVMVRAAFRIGNTMGQGGVRIIGTLGGVPR